MPKHVALLAPDGRGRRKICNGSLQEKPVDFLENTVDFLENTVDFLENLVEFHPSFFQPYSLFPGCLVQVVQHVSGLPGASSATCFRVARCK